MEDKPKRGRPPKEEAVEETKEPEKEAQSFTDQDIAEFKAWRESRRENIIANVQEDDAIRRKWKEESQMVKGIFRCHEPKGGSVRFAFRKYKWDPIRWYEFVDGQQYEVPLAVARHLNENCSYPIHSHIMDRNGIPMVDHKGRTESRMNFESTMFVPA